MDTLSLEEIKSIVQCQFQLIVQRNDRLRSRSLLSEDKHLNSRATDLVIIDWIEISTNYLNGLKALADFEDPSMVIQLYIYNYFILKYILDRADVRNQEDQGFIGTLNNVSQQLLNKSKYRELLDLAVEEASRIIESDINQDLYPVADQLSFDCDELSTRLFDLQEKILLIDVRTFDKFLKSHIEHDDIINIQPESVQAVHDFEDLVFCLQVGNIDFSEKLASFNQYTFVVVFGESQGANHVFKLVESAIEKRKRWGNIKVEPRTLEGGFERWLQLFGDDSAKTFTGTISTPSKPATSFRSSTPSLPPGLSLPLVRLHNYGSTCYINSMVQCLFNLSYFRNFMMDPSRFQPILRSNDNSLVLAFYALFNEFFYANGHAVVRPNNFVRLCSYLRPDLKIPHEQQDTSQFLYFILNRLHDELRIDDSPANRQSFKTNNPETDPFTDYGSSKEYLSWNSQLLKSEGVSPINKLFQIQQETKLKCGRCGYVSLNYDNLSMMNLNLNGNEYYLNDLILRNLEPEELSERLGNAWNCPKCEKLSAELKQLEEMVSSQESKKRGFFKFKKEEHATMDDYQTGRYAELKALLSQPNVSYRSSNFIKLPQILTIYLAKFDPYQNKLNIKLRFPKRLNFKIKRHDKEIAYSYKLSGWIDHLGDSIGSGHYTNVIHRSGQWVLCDDDRLSVCRYEEEIGDQNAYILFYTLVK
ncbi:hypothetical protein KL930_001010 [Ogataea haglerorum]|uniref:ubiquitinyl hydrolase 1 n=1 Tax=Ogataea haglerorum TaxID=1937702 RepID=A0AAN6I2V0_9ASCO|nr:uncharacterized protein KL911_001219 [Ogataea haglerorum]KAG7700322.1 hypothetical protein KL915_001011 [Ogataea haglerorum]KAG7701982.1 hypothetical protein KL951_000438 [Ogataea haglerorum]KAG7711794.1 hypothetical protein KL914_000436 [Ogataea haglerorum]KAG7730534.1 hypothetical protein KL933_000329 [Ogataea haglerorum]KAG7745299.1 hypothetical protein KL932_000329 [Ogataea haglerorum]